MYNTASHRRWMASWMVSRFERKNTSPFFKYTDYKSWVASHFHPLRRKTLQLRLLDIQNMKLRMIQCDPQILLFDMRQRACPLLNECEKKRSFYFHSKKGAQLGSQIGPVYDTCQKSVQIAHFEANTYLGERWVSSTVTATAHSNISTQRIVLLYSIPSFRQKSCFDGRGNHI